MADNNTIFRQKSLERVSSVDDMEKYIKTTTPSLWLLLISIIIFLVGVITWAAIGKINVESVSGCTVENGTVTCLISEDRYESLTKDSFIEINGNTYEIKKVNGPKEATSDGDLSILHTSNIEIGTWYYEVDGSCDLKDGEYKGKVVFEQVSPITFLIN